MARSAHIELNCAICNQPVTLETAKTDDNARTVHRRCYVLELLVKPTQQPVNRVRNQYSDAT
jgi:hypothetical protein